MVTYRLITSHTVQNKLMWSNMGRVNVDDTLRNPAQSDTVVILLIGGALNHQWPAVIV